MEEEKIEQTTLSSADSDKGEVTSYGKFRSAEELLNAYNSLESEFTRRSQRLKELENQAAERTETDKWSERVNALAAKYPVALELGTEITEELKSANARLEDDNCLEKALLGVLARRYRKSPQTASDTEKSEPVAAPPAEDSEAKLIADFAARAKLTPKVAQSSGEIPVAKYPRITTVAEAKKLTAEYLKKLKGE